MNDKSSLSPIAQRIDRRIEKLRLKYPSRRISRRSISTAIGSDSFIKNLVANPDQIPGGERLAKLALKLETSVDWLLYGRGREEESAPVSSVSSTVGSCLGQLDPAVAEGIERGIAVSYTAFFGREERAAKILAKHAMKYLLERPIHNIDLDQLDQAGIGKLSEILAQSLSDAALSKDGSHRA